jgi:hypothetical protein
LIANASTLLTLVDTDSRPDSVKRKFEAKRFFSPLVAPTLTASPPFFMRVDSGVILSCRYNGSLAAPSAAGMPTSVISALLNSSDDCTALFMSSATMAPLLRVGLPEHTPPIQS